MPDEARPRLFLDIDGVLNGSRFMARNDGRSRVSWTDRIDPACVTRLNRILAETSALVILSSDWRRSTGVEGTLAVLRGLGYFGGLHGATPVLGARYMEIRMYAAHNLIERWVALDDHLMPDLGDRVVQTDPRFGLTDADVARAIEILTRD
jgi:hypothetical protein